MAEKGLVESREEPRPEGEIGIARRIYKATGLGNRVFKAQQLALKYLSLGWEN
jgi:DNA-binding PadR family transcriptional regulator